MKAHEAREIVKAVLRKQHETESYKVRFAVQEVLANIKHEAEKGKSSITFSINTVDLSDVGKVRDALIGMGYTFSNDSVSGTNFETIHW